jgi:hypothetical protein
MVLQVTSNRVINARHSSRNNSRHSSRSDSKHISKSGSRLGLKPKPKVGSRYALKSRNAREIHVLSSSSESDLELGYDFGIRSLNIQKDKCGCPPHPTPSHKTKGATGPTGATGHRGRKGDDGDKGPKGCTGSRGRTGPDGHRGPNGPCDCDKALKELVKVLYCKGILTKCEKDKILDKIDDDLSSSDISSC